VNPPEQFRRIDSGRRLYHPNCRLRSVRRERTMSETVCNHYGGVLRFLRHCPGIAANAFAACRHLYNTRTNGRISTCLRVTCHPPHYHGAFARLRIEVELRRQPAYRTQPCPRRTCGRDAVYKARANIVYPGACIDSQQFEEFLSGINRPELNASASGMLN
jgi:hypothetical protein